MNGVPPIDEPPEDIDDHYRRVSALDQSRPAEATRRSILDHAAQLAAVRAAGNEGTENPSRRGAAQRRWKPAIFGSLLAAVLAGLLITPHFFPPAPPATPTPTPPRQRIAPAPGLLSFAAKKQAPLEAPAPAAASPPAAASARAPALDEARSLTQAQSVRSAGAPRTENTQSAALPKQAIDAGDSLRRAAVSGDITAIDSLLDQHADIESRDATGRTALMLATLGGRSDAVRELLAHGANPSAADAAGLTPMRVALEKNYPDIAAMLARAGAH